MIEPQHMGQQPIVPQQPQGFFNNVPPKFTFVFGLVIGIAAFSLFGYVSLLSRVSGTDVATAKKTTNTNTNGAVAGDTAGNPTNTNAAAPSAPVKPVSDTDYVRGNKDAAVTIVAYSDLECPFCKTFHQTTVEILKKYPNDVNLVYRHFPLSFHANAPKEAEAAECAGSLGGSKAYYDFIDKIFERTTGNGTGFALTALGPLAKEVGVDQKKFQDCLDAGKFKDKVDKDMAEGGASGVSGTPSSFVLKKDGTQVNTISGAQPLATVETTIKSALGQ